MRNFWMAAICLALAIMWQESPPASQESGYSALLRRCAEHETKALEKPSHFRYFERLEWSWGTETRSVIETGEGRADRIIEFDDEPLTPDQQLKQQHRLEKLLRDRDARHEEVSGQREEIKRRINMAKVLPEAVLLEFSGVEPNGELRFLFSPNPKFNPSSRETQIFKGMEGTIWLEPRLERIVRIEGRLVKDVNFGWGIFGKLYKGGEYKIEQIQVKPGVWRITTLNLDFKGRAFLFNQFKVVRKENNSNFIPFRGEISYADAVQSLLDGHSVVDASPASAGRNRYR